MKGEKKNIFLFFGFLFLILGLIIFKKTVFSYDTDITHPMLAEKAITLFNNQNLAVRLTAEQAAWVKRGAADEDTPTRWLNHFYNPNTGYGLTGFAPANVWADSSLAQAAYAKGDQSWQTAIKAYADGDPKRAFIALGHVLHLIEDMAVPAHTRIDPHAAGDPYEEWVKNNVKANYGGINFIKVNNLNQAFNYLANYSNKYFFSEDTINVKEIKKFNINEVEELYSDKKIRRYGKVKDSEGNSYKLLRIEKTLNLKEYSIDDSVHADYYSLLAPKAISYGAGVIDLFFKQAEAEKNKKPNKIEQIKQSIFKTSGRLISDFTGLFSRYRVAMTDLSDGVADGASPSNLAGKVLSAFEQAAGTEEQAESETTSSENNNGNTVAPEVGQPAAGQPAAIENSTVSEATPSSPETGYSPEAQSPASGPENQAAEQPDPSMPQEQVSGQQPPTNQPETERQPAIQPPLISIFVAGDSLAPKTTILYRPEPISSSTAAGFTFSANEANSTFECNLNDAGWQSCGSPYNLTGLADGRQVFKIRASDSSNNLETSPAEFSWSVDTIAPQASISGQPANFASSTAADFIFGADEDNVIFNCNLDVGDWAACLSPKSYENLSESAHVFKTKARDQAGNESAAPAEYAWTVDFTQPQITLVSGPPAIASSTVANFQFESSEDYTSYTCQLDINPWQTCSASTSAADLIEGRHTLTVQGADQAGNTGSSTLISWSVDLTTPTSTIDNLPSSHQATGFAVDWSGADADASGATTTASGLDSYDVQYKIGSGDWQSWLEATTSTSTLFSLAVDVGQTIYFRSRARDLAGNLGEWSAASQTLINSQLADYLVISEIQVSGSNANDEFIELYNPTSADMNLSGYSIQYRGGTAQNFYKKNFLSDSLIKAGGYFLLASDGYAGSATVDFTYSVFSLSGAGGTVFLVNGHDLLADNTASSSAVVDRLSYGAGDYLFPEGLAYSPAPVAGQSLERKARATSTASTMGVGGEHDNLGNAYDSDDNSNDFILRGASSAESSGRSRITSGNTSQAYSYWQSSFSWNHTVSGNNPVLLVTVHADGSYVNSVTANGRQLVLAEKKGHSQSYGNIDVSIYYLANPDQGGNNIAISLNRQAGVAASAITFNNCDMANPLNLNSSFSERTTGVMTHNVSTGADYVMLVDAVTYALRNMYSLSAISGQTSYFVESNNDGWSSSTNSLYGGASYKLTGEAGQKSMGWQADAQVLAVHAIIGLNPTPF